MAKSKGRQRKRHRGKAAPKAQEPPRVPEKPSLWSKLFDRWWKLLVEAATLVGAFLAFVALVPVVHLEISGSVQASSPMATVFALENDSVLFPIHDVDVICRVDELVSDIGTLRDVKAGQDMRGKLPSLSAGQQMSLPCHHAVAVVGPYKTKGVEMTILVSYRPDWVWWHRHTEFAVKAERASDGTWIWDRLPH